ncbi:MAG TPA: type I-U CRISPR-associated helicase/endonuclease Cas3 [Acidimicrobiales bacterium]|nr:type I-U CRISPR-associated helicase/endonuclease Cas3 [Acidimicrobiales bacterium]
MAVLGSPGGFAEFFEAVHGVAPFRWQQDLAAKVLTSGWPDVIDVPTGLGKTAVVDIAVFCLASQAEREPAERTAPTRTFVVVDRRVIVDQAFSRAKKLARALNLGGAGHAVGTVADALRSVAGKDAPALEVVRMRGGTTWAWRWLERPSQPAVIVSTVDQFGSRLLFRGYGVGERLRPIDAALCGTDALLILDEAHLSRPFVETAAAAIDHDRHACKPVLAGRRPRPVLLSATPPEEVAHEVFRPEFGAESSAEEHRRLAVSREARLIEVTTRKDPAPELAEALAALAAGGLESPDIQRVAVVCNTVALARATYRELARSDPEADIVLLIGRCRGAERELVVKECLPRLQAVLERPPAPKIIAVATQTIEVGADLDFDFLVTEAAPLDALLQRLGRLDRLGLRGRATAAVVRAAGAADDPVYGRATSRTWSWLVEQCEVPPATKVKNVVAALDGAPAVELGPSALGNLLTPSVRRELAAEAPLSPVVLGPVLEAWARTAPAPEPDQPVAPYLHGIERPAAEVLVCWRAGLPSPSNDFEAWEEELQSAPVLAEETVAVPVWEARRFLIGAPAGPVADIEGMPDPEEDLPDLDEREPVSAVVLTPDGEVVAADRHSLQPGMTLVLPSEVGGHDRWGWTGETGEPVTDVADVVAHARGRLRLRWRPSVVGIEELPRLPDGDADDPAEGLAQALSELQEAAPELRAGVAQIVGELAGSRGTRVVELPDRWKILDAPGGQALDPAISDDDEVSTSGSSEPVSLRRHLWDVAGLAEEQARLIGLPPPLVHAVELAGRAHDLGKADPRFQAMLHGGDALRALAASEPLAKSGMDPTDREAFRRARRRSGWPKGMRHEAISAALLAELRVTYPELFRDVDVDLVRHLVQSHHGHARPLLPPVVDEAPEDVTFGLPLPSGPDAVAKVPSDRDLVDWEGPSRFALLGRRYGLWGLALLEAIVRMADMEASATYQRRREP